jgi:hypothetical protein
MTGATIEIDMSKPCPRCGKMGAANGGPCLKCVLKAVKKGEFDERLAPLRERQSTPTTVGATGEQGLDRAGGVQGLGRGIGDDRDASGLQRGAPDADPA